MKFFVSFRFEYKIRATNFFASLPRLGGPRKLPDWISSVLSEFLINGRGRGVNLTIIL